jgi:glycosyltransferase involved in cell wall biosynthesis
VKILFVRTGKAFLPEIDAYVKYFNKLEGFEAYDSQLLDENYSIDDFDVIWEFKGFGGVRDVNKVIVHDYASLSTGSFPKVKNNLKKWLNPKPNLRVFLNQAVRQGFNFNDDIEFCYRDMGIDERFLSVKSEEKEYDFVYVGSICKGRGMDRFLAEFTRKPQGKLCLIGNVEDDIYNEYKHNKDLVFTGSVPYGEVPIIASKAVYGINYIPDKYPFNIQTSTKLLEYLALGLKVITTDYQWVRDFEKRHGCSFYKLNLKQDGFNRDYIKSYDYKSNFAVENHLWDAVLENSGLKEKIRDIVCRE